MKGFVIGLGKVIPGVSGAVLAMLFKVYEPALSCISNLKKDFYSNLKFLSCLGIGLVFAIVFGSNILLFFLNKYYLQTMFLFIGIMMSGISPIMKEAKATTIREKIVSCFIVLVLFLLTFLQTNRDQSMSSNVIAYFFSGILDAFASIVPGVSGTVLLMIMGTYSSVLGAYASVFDVQNFQSNFLILFPFFLGFVIGAYFISKLVNYAFKNYKNISYNCIAGFIITSILTLLIKINIFNFTTGQLFVSIIFLILGYLFAKKMNI